MDSYLDGLNSYLRKLEKRVEKIELETKSLNEEHEALREWSTEKEKEIDSRLDAIEREVPLPDPYDEGR